MDEPDLVGHFARGYGMPLNRIYVEYVNNSTYRGIAAFHTSICFDKRQAEDIVESFWLRVWILSFIDINRYLPSIYFPYICSRMCVVLSSKLSAGQIEREGNIW